MTKTFDIAGRPLGAGHPAFIIAEIGINHGGDEAAAAAMIEAAAAAGADAVKLQTVSVDDSYQPGTASYDAFQGKAFALDALNRLGRMARQHDIVLFSTPGDFPSLDLLFAAGMPAVKISSGLLTNLPLIRRAAGTGLPMILSTGMAHLAEVDAAVAAAEGAGARGIAVLQCTSLYPAPASSLNLRAIPAMAAHYRWPVGYSDHYRGDTACIAAVALGASVIEKHFTLDRSLPGADHAISAEPAEFARLVAAIRETERMLGLAHKAPVAEEEPLRAGRYRFLVARRAIAAGKVLEEADLALKRTQPGEGVMPANDLDRVLGRTAGRAMAAGDVVRPEFVEGL